MVTSQVPGYEHGNFIGPTILADVKPDMECYKVSSFKLSSHLLIKVAKIEIVLSFDKCEVFALSNDSEKF